MLDPAIDPAGLAGLAGPTARAVVGWLGTYFVHSTVLIGGVWALHRALPLDALTRNLLWKTALVGGLCTATLQTGLGVEPLLGSVTVASGPTAPAAPATITAPPAEVLEAEPASLVVPFSRACVGCDANMVVSADDDAVAAVFAAQPAIEAAAWTPTPTPTPTLNPIASAGAPGAASAAVWLVAGLFLLGAAASIGRLAGTFGRLRRTLRGRLPVGEGPLRERLGRLLARARVPAGSVRLTMSERIGSPIALAGREIVVPGRARALAPRQQEAMLAHELAHVLRRDPAWQVASAVIEAALFFQPLNQVARRGMQAAAEELCDDWAVRHTGSGVYLARCLAEVAGWPGRRDMSAVASAMTGRGSQLVYRVQRLLDVQVRERGRWSRRWRGLLGAALLAMVALGAPGLSLVAEASQPEAAEWPTSPDNGPALAPTSSLVYVPELPAVPVFALADAHAVHAHDVIVVQEPQPLTARQRRLLRRAERHAKKAVKLRGKAGALQPAATYKAIYVPVAPPAPPKPPRHAVVVGGPVHVVHHQDRCDDHDAHAHGVVVAPPASPRPVAVPHVEVDVRSALKAGEAGLRALARAAAEIEHEDVEATIERELAEVDFEAIAAQVEREVGQALREAERAHREAGRAHEQAERARDQAERARERSHRDARRQAEKAQRKAEKAARRGAAQARAAQAVEREVARAMRDGSIDAEERRRIEAAARQVGR